MRLKFEAFLFFNFRKRTFLKDLFERDQLASLFGKCAFFLRCISKQTSPFLGHFIIYFILLPIGKYGFPNRQDR